MDVEELCRTIESMAEKGYELFLIDHLHYFDLLKGNSTKSDYIEAVMVKIKLLLNRLKCKMIMIVHYRKMNGAKPTLDSWKDSISIPQNATYTINLWRDRKGSDKQYETTFLVNKSRNPNGEFFLKAMFDPLTNEYELMQPAKAGVPQDVETLSEEKLKVDIEKDNARQVSWFEKLENKD